LHIWNHSKSFLNQYGLDQSLTKRAIVHLHG
jgi:hypothetical protein